MTQTERRRPPLRIALLWHNPDSPNLGVGALSRAHTSIVSSIADDLGRTLEIRWLGNGSGLNDVRATGRGMVSDFLGDRRFAAALDGVSYAFDIAEGDSFSDLYGFRRFGRIAGLGAVVARRGIPVVMAPQTIGPFGSAAARAVARRSLSRRSDVWVRDAESAGVVRTLTPGTTADLASDVAFRLEAGRVDLGRSSKLRIGLNVSGLLMTDPQQMRRMGTSYGSTVFELARWLDAVDGIEVHLVPHVLGRHTTGESDEVAVERLGDRFPNMTVARNVATPEEVKGYISRLDGFIGSRMHACIAALSSGVPVLPLSYSPKFAGLFGSLGYDATFDLTSSSPAAVVAAVEAFLDERAVWKARADTANEIAQHRIDGYEAGVRGLLDNA